MKLVGCLMLIGASLSATPLTIYGPGYTVFISPSDWMTAARAAHPNGAFTGDPSAYPAPASGLFSIRTGQYVSGTTGRIGGSNDSTLADRTFDSAVPLYGFGANVYFGAGIISTGLELDGIGRNGHEVWDALAPFPGDPNINYTPQRGHTYGVFIGVVSDKPFTELQIRKGPFDIYGSPIPQSYSITGITTFSPYGLRNEPGIGSLSDAASPEPLTFGFAGLGLTALFLLKRLHRV